MQAYSSIGEQFCWPRKCLTCVGISPGGSRGRVSGALLGQCEGFFSHVHELRYLLLTTE